MTASYLNSVHQLFEYYRSLGDKTFSQLSDEELFLRPTPESNSIAIIVNHLWGNMLSRWTDFLHSDGEKEWRERDLEFEEVIQDREGLLKKWNEGWDCLFTALNSINEDNFHLTVYIRKQEHTIIEAINRQLGHYAYHVGQIVLIGTLHKGKSWESLSIPKGESKAFNEKKQSRGKHGGHFTDDIR